jgi:hypothetical protein
MKGILSRRPSPAMIIAIVALIAALGGTAIAGGGFLTTKKFKNQAVRGPVQYISVPITVPATPTTVPEGVATCPTGTKVIGGGAQVTPVNGTAFIDDSYPSGGNSWHAKFDNSSATGYTGTVTAICATAK